MDIFLEFLNNLLSSNSKSSKKLISKNCIYKLIKKWGRNVLCTNHKPNGVGPNVVSMANLYSAFWPHVWSNFLGVGDRWVGCLKVSTDVKMTQEKKDMVFFLLDRNHILVITCAPWRNGLKLFKLWFKGF